MKIRNVLSSLLSIQKQSEKDKIYRIQSYLYSFLFIGITT